MSNVINFNKKKEEKDIKEIFYSLPISKDLAEDIYNFWYACGVNYYLFKLAKWSDIVKDLPEETIEEIKEQLYKQGLLRKWYAYKCSCKDCVELIVAEDYDKMMKEGKIEEPIIVCCYEDDCEEKEISTIEELKKYDYICYKKAIF